MGRGIISCLLGLVLSGSLASGQDLLHGVGAIGDSLTDEYQFADNGGHSAGRNWLEQLVTSRGLNFGTPSATGWGYPRNQGYKYNWACAGATSTDLISQNQHTGVQNQIQNGDVSLVCMMIGVNDFSKEWPGPPAITNYQNIYKGGPSVGQQRVDAAIANVKTAVTTVLGASTSVKLVLATIPDVELTPYLRQTFDNETRRKYVSDAIAEFNRRIEDEVHDLDPDRIAIADTYQLSVNVLNELHAGRNYFVGGYEVDLNQWGDEPDKIILADKIHPGTIMQGLIANEFLKGMNEFGANLPLLTDREILANAGVPEPATALILIAGGLAAARRSRR